jgi:hypothetical protein
MIQRIRCDSFLNSINWLAFVTETESVLFVAGTESLNFRLQRDRLVLQFALLNATIYYVARLYVVEWEPL